ncbi:hypothetical protein MPC4_200077 [Methylocella tundrae]|uniref:Uncharacterized protein n=1 Tax=Methylocella tundrae TaxID=227605 RepID=A0A8B6M776_METTU|nr:hypothetical protein MPC1_700001 [Methylocella tundrae]VTZ50193.1 hypothetical protein MPC4_200077 [Methylocella tundrae]
MAAIGGGGGFAGSASVTSSGVLGGGQVGYNYSFGNNFLLGLETDFDGAAIRGKGAVSLSGFSGLGSFSVNARSKINDLGTARAPRLLVGRVSAARRPCRQIMPSGSSASSRAMGAFGHLFAAPDIEIL